MSVNDATGMWVDDGLSELRHAQARKEALEAKLSALRQSEGGCSGRSGRATDETDYDRIWRIAKRGQEIQRKQNELASLIKLVRRKNKAALRRLKLVAEQIGGAVELLRLVEKKITPHTADKGAASDFQLLRRVSEGLLETYVRMRMELPDFVQGTYVERYKAAMRDEIRAEMRYS